MKCYNKWAWANSKTLSPFAKRFHHQQKCVRFDSWNLNFEQWKKREEMQQWRVMAKEALNQTSTVARFLCLLHVTNNYICSSTLAYGPSMLPTLNLTGDVILSEHLSHRLGRLGPGDVVLVRSPMDPTKIVTKRILGMEGDRVTFFDPRTGDTCRNVVVPKGHVWIQGDNIYASHDSRHFGPVPYGLITGRAFFRVWPPDSFGGLGP